MFPATWGPWGVLTAQEPVKAVDPQKINKIVNALSDLAEAASEDLVTIDKTVGFLESDPELIVEWVSSETHWLPYHGYLKGPEGTFEARQGSSLDRVVLMARMLSKAGRDVRIVHSRLDEKLKPTLLEELKTADFWKDWSVDDEPLAEKIKDHADALEHFSILSGKPVEDAFGVAAEYEHQLSLYREQMMAAVSSQSDRLLDTVDFAKTPSLDYTQFAEDYFYVEYAEGENWKQVCPVFGVSIPEVFLKNAQPTKRYSSTADFPDELVHKFQIRFVVEQFLEGVKSEKIVLENEWLVSEINLSQISLVIQGEKFAEMTSILSAEGADFAQKQQKIVELIKSESQWTPGLILENEEDPIVQNSFNGRGEVFEVEKGMGQGQTLNKAIGILGALDFGAKTKDEPSGESVLSRITIETIATNPMGQRDVNKRKLFELSEEELKGFAQSGELDENSMVRRGFACTRNAEMFIQASKLTKNGYLKAQVDLINAYRLPIKYLLRNLEDENQSVTALFKIFEKLPRRDLLLVSLGLVRSTLPEAAGTTYFDTANVLTTMKQLVYKDGKVAAVTGFDILENKMGSLGSSSEERQKDLVEIGVFDTLAESTFLRASTGNHMSLKTDLAFPEHLSEENWVKIDSKNIEKYRSTTDPYVYAIWQEELKEFQALVVADIKNPTVWYHVDENTGETLGMGVSELGLAGNAATEYTITKSVVAIALIKGAVAGTITFFGCHSVSSGTIGSFSGCLMCAILMAIFVIGSNLAAPGSMAEWAMYGGETISGLCAVGMTQSG
ncbi:MAG: hypothetical protein MI748_02900 [Opitutales bacterium]|nr:hypothetical protein [Opitutales bacterium]